ncbi:MULTISPECIES: VWA domain-containing protein [Rhizobium]|uniref:VWA domain-containing protein n=1 Tax=Rhizobium leguminosarum bv. viciae TaxID=387 RepID=A0A8G2MTG6_RHILV|nr:VWA domain-containing protein [Rhizobium leguminosarum]MBY5425148.1 VWA domain-containing protein [Rhizobium leguminosarum]NKK05434.1 VWA domain-containing protein [Rhizobium leguminosarum bv. viciae]NKK19604.1 VWA domain-containing protein [Rhizobium leguminosarum bv. viciae]TBX96878.1 VWA domain-containing protein [Rhizobium leguminosarum bv. viciae]TBZ23684.1 VWA domain-containing protein [Rhizobium leguminosarum bv. viciae]
MIADFHFLRPWLLLLLALPAAIVWMVSRSGDIRAQWKGMIAPHLLDRLVVDTSGRSRMRPSWLLATVLTAGIAGAAGPTWQREPPPFVEDTAPLVIAVDLSQTMDAIDVTPSRLERAKLKIKDVIEARQGARTAIVAYAGTAHLVLPPTEDAALLESYSEALATRIMPTPGKDTAAALRLGQSLLHKEGVAGTILLLTDGVEAAAAQTLKSSGGGVVILGIGTSAGGPVKTPDGGFLSDASGIRLFPKLDVAGFEAIGKETGADVATVTDDDADVRWIMQRIRSNFAQKQETEGDRWRDFGWWLVVPVAVAMALSFRKGWVVRLATLLLALRMLSPGSAHADGLIDMWLTSDQQGRIAFERGNYDEAADRFVDPMWKGVALYRAGKFREAIDAFASIDTAESWYDQGNALLQLSKFEQAVAAYEKALDKRSEWPDAKANLTIAQQLLKQQKEKQEEQPEQPSEDPDSVQFDEKGKEGKEGQIDIAEQTSEMWMKNINVSPADLMARKFSLEARRQSP